MKRARKILELTALCSFWNFSQTMAYHFLSHLQSTLSLSCNILLFSHVWDALTSYRHFAFSTPIFHSQRHPVLPVAIIILNFSRASDNISDLYVNDANSGWANVRQISRFKPLKREIVENAMRAHSTYALSHRHTNLSRINCLQFQFYPIHWFYSSSFFLGIDFFLEGGFCCTRSGYFRPLIRWIYFHEKTIDAIIIFGFSNQRCFYLSLTFMLRCEMSLSFVQCVRYCASQTDGM